jgi:hypothetical protein
MPRKDSVPGSVPLGNTTCIVVPLGRVGGLCMHGDGM